MQQKTSAFTLMELSIVLAVVGMIVGAITVGRTMADAAALQGVISDFDRYRTATMAFRDKYKALPGDMMNASTVWTADPGCPAPTASDAFITTTCDGNGNGFIGDSSGDPLGAQASYGETLFFWQHLANEQFIDIPYNGRLSTASNGITPGVNVPKSKMTTASFSVRFFPTNDGVSANYFPAAYNHVFFLGAFSSTATAYQSPAYFAGLSADDAKAIDLKIDDGRPGLGKVLAPNNTGLSSCASTNVATSAVYDASQPAPNCSLIFVTGF